MLLGTDGAVIVASVWRWL